MKTYGGTKKMKKILFELTLLFIGVTFCFTGCNDDYSSNNDYGSNNSEESYYTKDYSIAITNASDVDLVVDSIGISSASSTKGEWGYSYGETGTTKNVNKTISSTSGTNTSTTIEAKVEYTSSYAPDTIIINCHYTTPTGTTAYPYVGDIDGETVTQKQRYKDGAYEKLKTNTAYFGYKSGLMLNFVKTTSGDYVLAIVK